MRRLSIFLALLLVSSAALTAPSWQTVAPGLHYQKLLLPKAIGQIHLFRIDPAKYRFKVAFAHEQRRQTLSVRQLAQQNQALLAINGGFFTPEKNPIGLRINDGAIKTPLKKTSWWGVFYQDKRRAYIVPPHAFYAKKSIQFAVQGGPRLLINGRIPKLKPGIAERSAIGVTTDQHIILAITEHAPITTTQLAVILQQPGIGCANALNLDGGGSSQLYADFEQLKLYIPGYSSITDAILVLPRGQSNPRNN